MTDTHVLFQPYVSGSAFNPATLYGGGAEGYIDHPRLVEASAQ